MRGQAGFSGVLARMYSRGAHKRMAAAPPCNVCPCSAAAGAAAREPVSNATKHGSLLDCLNTIPDMEIVTGANDTYTDARQVFSKFFDLWPSAIVYPNTTEQARRKRPRRAARPPGAARPALSFV